MSRKGIERNRWIGSGCPSIACLRKDSYRNGNVTMYLMPSVAWISEAVTSIAGLGLIRIRVRHAVMGVQGLSPTLGREG